MKTSSTAVSVRPRRLVVLRDRRARGVDAPGVGVALRLGQVVHHVGDDRLGRLEPERRRVADVELEDLVALGLEPLGLDQDRPAYVVPDVLELAALDDLAHAASLAEVDARPAGRIFAPRMGVPGVVTGRVAPIPACATSAIRRSSLTAKALFRVLGLRFQLSGTEHVPDVGRRAARVQPRVLHRLRPRRARGAALAAAGPLHGQARGVRPLDRRAGDALDAPHLRRPGRRWRLDGRGAALPPGR